MVGAVHRGKKLGVAKSLGFTLYYTKLFTKSSNFGVCLLAAIGDDYRCGKDLKVYVSTQQPPKAVHYSTSLVIN